MALDATVSGLNSNSYITVTEATAIFAERLGVGTDWSGLSSPDKEAALITATRRLDQEEYEGAKTLYNQALQFPRLGIYDKDSILYASTAIPKPLQLACAELALAIVRNPEIFDDTGLEPFSSFSADDFSVSTRGIAAGRLPAQVRRFLSDFLIGSDGDVALVRG